ncbi:MAG: nucleoside phosphorylase [Bacteroidetes bacterium]|nr:nucleoside phosphorylase [Bacteroidota bacterium]
MNSIAASELIINQRGAVYHINTRPEELAHTIITVGDPDRVKEVSKLFDKIEFKNQHREFILHTGYLGNKRLSVVSTGIGPDNIDIVLNELDALVNIDFETRTIKPRLTSLKIIRIGTAGSLQREIATDSFVASTHGLGIDNLLNFYAYQKTEEDIQLLQYFKNHVQLQQDISSPYINAASISLLKEFVQGFHQGITVTCPGFYGPQGRVLRMGLASPKFIDRLSSFNFGNHRISNFEMETAAIYGMGKILGHQCLSLSAIVANRISGEFSKDGSVPVAQLIQKTLQIISDKI